jgi:RsiW-degrading membrane proteinase PrsW (M82 family)
VTTGGLEAQTICAQCGRETAALDYCVRCGFRQEGEAVLERRRARRRYAAEPTESVRAPRIASTLFPQLPRADLSFFNSGLLIGLAVIVALAVLGYFSVALAVAAVLVPSLLLIYMYSVDVYERQPVFVMAWTIVWGAVSGVLLGLVVQHIAVVNDPPSVRLLTRSDVVARAIVVPALGVLLALVGMLVLLRYPRFNDVLDGTTFGASTAAALAGAQTLVTAWPLVSAGLRPAGAPGPWVARLFEIGLLIPLVWAGALGLVGASFWLRFRAPVRDRHELGIFSAPIVALLAAVVLLALTYAGLAALSRNVGVVWIGVVAVAALLSLRRAIHVGLLEEADEISIGPDVVCANCGRSTPLHSFCGRCGIALRALPKQRQQHVDADRAELS